MYVRIFDPQRESNIVKVKVSEQREVSALASRCEQRVIAQRAAARVARPAQRAPGSFAALTSFDEKRTSLYRLPVPPYGRCQCGSVLSRCYCQETC